MKIYGFTIIDTDDNGIDGCSARYSETYLFADKNVRDEKAWEMFRDSYQADVNDDRIDDSLYDKEQPSVETFLLRLANSGYDYYGRYNSDYQIEVFETDLQ